MEFLRIEPSPADKGSLKLEQRPSALSIELMMPLMTINKNYSSSARYTINVINTINSINSINSINTINTIKTITLDRAVVVLGV